MRSQEPVLINTIENGVRILRFNRPKKYNAFNDDMYNGFMKALLEAGADPQTVITVITGTGEYFSSGNDIGNFMKAEEEESSSVSDEADPDTEEGQIAVVRKKGVNRFEKLINILIEFPKPLIAVVNGPAVGVGVTMLPLVDVVYASDKATFLTPFVKSALSPEGCSSYLFPRIMGPGKAAEMLLFNKKITAADAYECGFVTEVYPHKSLHKVWPKIHEWAKLPPNSLHSAKALISSHKKEYLKQVNHQECDQLALTLTKGEFTTAVMEFFNRKSKL
ncbi:enoyl-CoA delta isomerase 2-like [Macrobrachium rosenbergii]|uniref:enoyl-CoA delta isomerase 2-like n=1 Tax=Macrobrachium rosenbergii TaxID=79674 RepID=UPI0034D76259